MSEKEILQEFFFNLEFFELIKSGDTFTLVSGDRTTPILSISSRNPKRITYHNPHFRIDTDLRGGCFLLTPGLVRAFEQARAKKAGHTTLNSEDIDPPNLADYINAELEKSRHRSQDHAEQLWDQVTLWVELTKSFSEETLISLTTGYLPREHLVLAVLMDRFPELRKYVNRFPLLLTCLAEEVYLGRAWDEKFLQRVDHALRSGWEGMFRLCGLPSDPKTVGRITQVQLRFPLIPSSRTRDPEYDCQQARLVIDHLLNYDHVLDYCSPPYDEAWLQNLDAFQVPVEIRNPALNQLNGVLRTKNLRCDVSHLIDHTTKQRCANETEWDAYFQSLGENVLPILSLYRMLQQEKPESFDSLGPEDIPPQRSSWELRRETTFKQMLTKEEQSEYGHLLGCKHGAYFLEILKASDLSAGVLTFLASWNFPEVHKAIIQHPNVPLSLLEFLYPLYQEEVCEAPSLAFAQISGEASGIHIRYVGLVGDLGIRRNDCKPPVHYSDDEYEDWWLANMVNAYAETGIGHTFATVKDPMFCCEVARSLRAPTDSCLWELLANDKDWEVRANLALNPFKASSITRLIAEDPDTRVRGILAAQPLCIIEPVLEMLSKDKDPSVQLALSCNGALKRTTAAR